MHIISSSSWTVIILNAYVSFVCIHTTYFHPYPIQTRNDFRSLQQLNITRHSYTQGNDVIELGIWIDPERMGRKAIVNLKGWVEKGLLFRCHMLAVRRDYEKRLVRRKHRAIRIKIIIKVCYYYFNAISYSFPFPIICLERWARSA